MLNRFAFWVLFPMFIVAVFFIYRDAANAQLRVIGLAILGAFFLFVMYLFVFKLCVYDYAIFSEEGIELHTPFKQKVYYRYKLKNWDIIKALTTPTQNLKSSK